MGGAGKWVQEMEPNVWFVSLFVIFPTQKFQRLSSVTEQSPCFLVTLAHKTPPIHLAFYPSQSPLSVTGQKHPVCVMNFYSCTTTQLRSHLIKGCTRLWVVSVTLHTSVGGLATLAERDCMSGIPAWTLERRASAWIPRALLCPPLNWTE